MVRSLSRKSSSLHEVAASSTALDLVGLRFTRSALVLACGLALLPACHSVFPSGPTPVAQGKYYGSGNPEYDAFFIELHKTQVSVGGLPARFASARNALTDGLGVSRDLATDAIVENVRARAQDLSRQGVMMKLQLNQTAVLLTRPQERSAAVRQLAEPLEKGTTDLLTLSRELDENQKLFDVLEQRRATLHANASRNFGSEGPLKVQEVEQNLEDARQVLVVMRDRTTEHETQTKALLDGLALAADTSHGEFARPAEPAPESEPAPTPARSRHNSSKPSPKGKAAPKAAAPSAPKGEPKAAPKPAPKPAPSEAGGFEP